MALATTARVPGLVVSGTWTVLGTSNRLAAVTTNDGDTTGIQVSGFQAQNPFSFEERWRFEIPPSDLPNGSYIVGYRLTVRARGHSGESGAAFSNALILALPVPGLGQSSARPVTATYSDVGWSFSLTPLEKPGAPVV